MYAYKRAGKQIPLLLDKLHSVADDQFNEVSMLPVDRFSVMTRGIERFGCNFVHYFFLFIEPLHCHKIKTNYPDVTVCVGICPGMANVPQSAVNARKHKEKRVPTWLLGNEIGDWCCKNLSSVY